MIQAMRLLGRLLDPDLAQRALEMGDDGALNEARESLLVLVEQGLTPMQLQQSNLYLQPYQKDSVA